MHFLAFLTFILMAAFATTMALPLESDAHLAEGAAGEHDQSYGLVGSAEPNISANPEDFDHVPGDIEFDEDHPALKLSPRNDCASGHKFCGECNGTSCKMAYVNLEGSCVVQRGGGDGKYCGGPRTGYMVCPGW
ncbi:uncharacterized protein LDX57_005014 [Aspergillus melleus]|uniref:uncharacterized protein n=1 Tax=Aspergillus melleus TaxID=138277 RepID=UPI001E8D0CF9|nr:uncharacterized protein LDX57_005014 [Aspergillus melleus]KAH8427300.1 hypothetical protein LDX57_005014 [Aspergillus melleus]